MVAQLEGRLMANIINIWALPEETFIKITLAEMRVCWAHYVNSPDMFHCRRPYFFKHMLRCAGCGGETHGIHFARLGSNYRYVLSCGHRFVSSEAIDAKLNAAGLISEAGSQAIAPPSIF